MIRRLAILAAAMAIAAPVARAQESDPIGEALRDAVLPPAPQAAQAPPPVPPAAPASSPAPAPNLPPSPVIVPPTQPPAPVSSAGTDEAEEAEAGLPPGPLPYTPQAAPPRAPAPYRPARSESYTYEGYDARLRSSFASAQGLLGTLDGGWTLTDAAGRRLFAFRLVDRGNATGALEGVWRDLRRTPTPTSSGLIGTVQRIGSQLTLTFAAARGGFTTVTLAQSIDGSWGGRLAEPNGESAVSLRRDD